MMVQATRGGAAGGALAPAEAPTATHRFRAAKLSPNFLARFGRPLPAGCWAGDRGALLAHVAGRPRSPEITPRISRTETSFLGRPACGSRVSTHTPRRGASGRPPPRRVTFRLSLHREGAAGRRRPPHTCGGCGLPSDRRWVAPFTRSGLWLRSRVPQGRAHDRAAGVRRAVGRGRDVTPPTTTARAGSQPGVLGLGARFYFTSHIDQSAQGIGRHLCRLTSTHHRRMSLTSPHFRYTCQHTGLHSVSPRSTMAARPHHLFRHLCNHYTAYRLHGGPTSARVGKPAARTSVEVVWATFTDCSRAAGARATSQPPLAVATRCIPGPLAAITSIWETSYACRCFRCASRAIAVY